MSLYSLYPSLIRPLIFCLDAETAHSLTIKAGKFLSNEPLKALFSQKVEDRPVEFMGLEFKNPLGLAAGMDKNGDAIDYLGSLGFGHLELGTVTPRPQPGNEKPRMFRVLEAKGIINRMGFNNKGVDYLVANLIKRTYKGVVGVSIGKNETTPLERASDDYLLCMDKVYNYCDYIAVNISCPNTPGLTALQDAEPLKLLLTDLKTKQDDMFKKMGRYVPLVVKIAPDLKDDNLSAVCKVCTDLEIDGMNCTNTTVSRDVIHGMTHAREWGGLSGEPLREMSTKVLVKVSELTNGKMPLIGCGGVSDVISAREKVKAGATLIQLYSGFVYEGPAVIKEIVENL